jgi:hypothetical protein
MSSIASDDALIPPHRANPREWDFRERHLFDHVRKNFPIFLQSFPRTQQTQSLKGYENSDSALWASANPLKAVMLFTIDANPMPEWAGLVSPPANLNLSDYALVVCSEVVADPNAVDFHWNFTTLKGPNIIIGYHPVSGTRQFGIGMNKSDAVFYVRGADRPTTWMESSAQSLLLAGQKEYWRTFQSKLIDFVKGLNGEAVADIDWDKQYDWDQLRAYLYGPSSTQT